MHAKGFWTVDQLVAVGWSVEEAQSHIATMAKIQRHCAEIAALEKGRKYFSSEELAIIYHRDMPYEEKWWRVSAIRHARAAKRARRHQKAPMMGKLIPFERRIGSPGIAQQQA
jgi:hypothetical protein